MDVGNNHTSNPLTDYLPHPLKNKVIRMKKINMNKLAKQVSAVEGGAVNLSIAQIKEVIHHTFGILDYEYLPSEIMDAIERVGKYY